MPDTQIAPLDRLLSIMEQLRHPKTGCEWDREQTFATIAPYTIEEAYEVADAIERNDIEGLRDELGDLLLQVVFHARMAEEAGQFAFEDVAAAISDKLEARHPHIFGGQAHDGERQTDRWEKLKAAEREAKGATSAMDGIAQPRHDAQQARDVFWIGRVDAHASQSRQGRSASPSARNSGFKSDSLRP